MNRIIKKSILALIIGTTAMTGCKNATNNSEKTIRSGLPVTVSHIRTGNIVNYMDLSATSSFLFKALVKAPVTGYIDNMVISQGESVEKNQLLITIRTKEASAILNDTLNILKFSGLVNVKTAVAGFISSIEHPKGDYVSEGDQLCQIAVPGSLVFILDVPFEMSGTVKINTPCEIILPNGRTLHGIVKSRFPSMDLTAQTERYVIKVENFPDNIPENLVAKIRIVRNLLTNAVSLPKTCILTDETMQNFWVMKLVNDSMAVKVPVLTGINQEEFIQITKPVFNISDLFLTSGNYGLNDTAFVKVIKPAEHE